MSGAGVRVIGAGLAGCEAAWQLAQSGIPVRLYEMKPIRFSPAHTMAGFAEMVCSNSLKADRIDTASGLLKAEMRLFGSLLLEAASHCAVPAGGALAVDRERLSAWITAKIEGHPRIEVCREEVTRLPEDGQPAILATGPLTSGALADAIAARVGRRALSFYDAAAPIVAADSIDYDRAFFAARYGHGEADYLNCPMDKAEYEAFYEALIHAERAELHRADADFRVYAGCMPVEVMAARGPDTIRYGPLRPVGLRDPRTGHRPWAVVQLRREDAAGSRYGLVGFQTNLRFPEQKRVFSMIPGLEHAEFVRYGVMHRNTFLDAPRLLDGQLRLRCQPNLRFAGQMTGVEGYVESAATGILAARFLRRELRGAPPLLLPPDTMLGALMGHLGNTEGDYQPMGSNMGLLPPLESRIKSKRERYEALSRRAMASLRRTLEDAGEETVI